MSKIRVSHSGEATLPHRARGTSTLEDALPYALDDSGAVMPGLPRAAFRRRVEDPTPHVPVTLGDAARRRRRRGPGRGRSRPLRRRESGMTRAGWHRLDPSARVVGACPAPGSKAAGRNGDGGISSAARRPSERDGRRARHDPRKGTGGETPEPGPVDRAISLLIGLLARQAAREASASGRSASGEN